MSEKGEAKGIAEAESEEAAKRVDVRAGESDGDGTKESEVLVERMEGDAEDGEESGSGEEGSSGSEETEVLSEERTEIVGSGEEKDVGEESNKEEEVDQETRDKEEEVEQEDESEERDILVLDDEEAGEDKQPEEIVDQRSTRHRARTARKLAEIFATSEERTKGEEEQESEEEEEVPLTRRSRVVTAGETPVHGDEQDDSARAEQEGETEAEEERLRKERKRKVKQIAQPVKKKVRQASRNVVIQEPIQVPYEAAKDVATEEEEATDDKETAKMECRAKKRQENPQPHYKKTFIKLDNHLLQRMEKFKDLKCKGNARKGYLEEKKEKSGKKLHPPSLQDLEAEERFMEYKRDVPEALAKEFFTSFRFKTTTDLDKISISFRVFDKKMQMNLTKWSVRLGLHSAGEAVSGEWGERDIGLPRSNLDFDPQSAWKSLTHSRSGAYKPTQSRGNHIVDPVHRLAQVFLGYNLLGQANSSSTTTQAELYFM